jgi:hypothetical protein
MRKQCALVLKTVFADNEGDSAREYMRAARVAAVVFSLE